MSWADKMVQIALAHDPRFARYGHIVTLSLVRSKKGQRLQTIYCITETGIMDRTRVAYHLNFSERVVVPEDSSRYRAIMTLIAYAELTNTEGEQDVV